MQALFQTQQHARAITVVDLGGCAKVDDGVVAALAAAAPGLVSVHLTGCIKVTDKALAALARHCPYIQDVDVGSCVALQDAGLRTFLAAAPHLMTVRASCCEITDAAFASALAGQGPGLDCRTLGAQIFSLDLGMTNAGDGTLLALFGEGVPAPASEQVW